MWTCQVAVAIENLPAQCKRYKTHVFGTCIGKIPWRRKCQPAPVFLPGESQGRRSLVGCRLWGRTELDKTEVT